VSWAPEEEGVPPRCPAGGREHEPGHAAQPMHVAQGPSGQPFGQREGEQWRGAEAVGGQLGGVPTAEREAEEGGEIVSQKCCKGHGSMRTSRHVLQVLSPGQA
jgi:hypothetical protein